MAHIRDISDKGKRQGKLLRYEVGLYYKPNPETSDEIAEIVAKFKRHGDAWQFASFLANAPDATEVLIRS